MEHKDCIRAADKLKTMQELLLDGGFDNFPDDHELIKALNTVVSFVEQYEQKKYEWFEDKFCADVNIVHETMKSEVDSLIKDLEESL